ncbi:MAG: hypothetical protein IMW99_10880 [Firmicutes bacterium]|nr:hypothetical protein [Bacillota bacterium]
MLRRISAVLAMAFLLVFAFTLVSYAAFPEPEQAGEPLRTGLGLEARYSTIGSLTVPAAGAAYGLSDQIELAAYGELLSSGFGVSGTFRYHLLEVPMDPFVLRAYAGARLGYLTANTALGSVDIFRGGALGGAALHLGSQFAIYSEAGPTYLQLTGNGDLTGVRGSGTFLEWAGGLKYHF